MGNGDVMGDGQLGPQSPEGVDPAVQQQTLGEESVVRQTLLNDAYGTKLPSRRKIDKD